MVWWTTNARIKRSEDPASKSRITPAPNCSDDIKSRMVKQNVTAVWDGFDVEGRGWIDKSTEIHRQLCAPSREFFNLVGGRAGGWYKSPAMVPTLPVQSVWTSRPLTLTEYGVSVFTHELTHVNDRDIYLGGHGRDKVSGPEGYAQGLLQSPVPGQPGWVPGSHMALIQMMAVLVFHSSPTPSRTELVTSIHYMWRGIRYLMLLDYLRPSGCG